MLSQIKTEIFFLTAFIAINYFIYGVSFKRFCFMFENFRVIFLGFFFCGAANPNALYGVLIHDVSTSYTTTHHSR